MLTCLSEQARRSGPAAMPPVSPAAPAEEPPAGGVGLGPEPAVTTADARKPKMSWSLQPVNGDVGGPVPVVWTVRGNEATFAVAVPHMAPAPH